MDEEDTTNKSDSKDGEWTYTLVIHLMYNTLIEGHSALAGLGTYGLPDPFASHSKRGSKPSSKPVDYFKVYGGDSSEADDDIEKILSPKKNVEKHNKSATSSPPMKTTDNNAQAVQTDSIPVNADSQGNTTDMDHHSPPPLSRKNVRKQDDFAIEGDEMEFVNPLLDDKDEDQQATTEEEESESEWEKELKLKRDQKAVDQPSLVTPNHPTTLQKPAPSVDDQQLSPTNDSSISEVLTNEPSSQAHSEQIPLENNNNTVTRSLKDNTSIQHNGIGDRYPSPLSSKEASSPLPVSPSTIKDMEATKRYQQKQSELLSVLEGRRKQLENSGKDKVSDNTPVKRSTRIDEELANIKRPSINELRSTWEGQQQDSSDMLSPPHNKSTNRAHLEPIKSSPRSLSEIDNSHHLLNKGNVANVATTPEDQASFQQPMPTKTSESSETLFSEEEEESSNSIPQTLESSTMPDATTQLAVKSLEMEKLTGADEQKQQSLTSPLEQPDQSASSNKPPVMTAAEETGQERQLQQETGELVEGQDNNGGNQHISNPNSDVLASYQSDQRTTPTDERITDHNGTEKHPTDDFDDMILNGSISLSSQHTTTDLSMTHNVVSPVPFLSSSLPRPSTMAGYGRSTSSLLGK